MINNIILICIILGGCFMAIECLYTLSAEEQIQITRAQVICWSLATSCFCSKEMINMYRISRIK